MDGKVSSADNVKEKTAQENSQAPMQLSDAIDRLLANPELLSTVASAIGVSKPPLGDVRGFDENEADKGAERDTEQQKSDKPEQASDTTVQKLPEMMATLAPILSALSDTKGSPNDDRSRLLYALKPYVSGHRREAIDTMVQLSKLSEVFKSVR